MTYKIRREKKGIKKYININFSRFLCNPEMIRGYLDVQIFCGDAFSDFKGDGDIVGSLCPLVVVLLTAIADIA